MFSNTDRWYTNHPHFNIYLRECNDYDPGQLTYYFKHDAELRSVIVMLADGTVPEAVAELDSYVGSKRLKEMIKLQMPSIGVVALEP